MIVIDKNYRISEAIDESQTILVYRGERIADHQCVIIKLIKSNYIDLNEIFLLQNQYHSLQLLIC